MIWTEREIALAYELFNRDASEQEFLDALGRTKNCARVRLDRKARSKNWTDEDTRIARKMFADNESGEAFLSRLGRTRCAAADRVKRVDHKAAIESKPIRGSTIPTRVSAEALADAMRRAVAPRTLTARVCGDPAPGQSALDRRGARA